MRRENSTFNMSYISQPGVKALHNNDYFGCSVLDEFACYVVANGMRSANDKQADPSARLAVEAVITAFNNKPSISRLAVTGYLEAAHRALKNNEAKKRCKASITVVVTNYQKLRYGFAGNCRFHLYRSGKVLNESGDHSLSWEMMEDGELLKDKIAVHAERNNLRTYCGTTKIFHPTVSKKIKLRNADIFSLFTRGIWENARNIDILSAVQVSENDPEEAARNVERLILDAIPPDGRTENYTICFVFIDKVYLDPERKKRIKRIIILSVIALIVIAVVVILLIWNNNRRENWRNDMQIAYHSGLEYIQGNNFIRAKEKLETSYALAEKLREKKIKSDISDYQMLVDAVLYADELQSAGSYEQALDAYGAAANQSKYADNLAKEYIEKGREKASDYMNVQEYLFLGNTLSDLKDWDNAEEKYLTARSLASQLFYIEGKKEANESLQTLYQSKEAALAEQQEQAQAEVAAAEFIIEGDNAMREDDLVAASLFYQMARDKYEELGNEAIVASIDKKLGLVDAKFAQNDYQTEYAAQYVKSGDEMENDGEYIDAKRFYLLAREIYANLGDAEKLREVQAKMDLVELYMANDSKGVG